MDPGETGGLRCSRCGGVVQGTRHTRTGYTVGHYVLHTGRTVASPDDEAPVTYRRLLDPLEVVSCPTCFARPDVQRLWLAFGDEESSAA